MQYRYENFGVILSSTRPSYLLYVDKKWAPLFGIKKKPSLESGISSVAGTHRGPLFHNK
jgi:hypothetical protein